MASFSLGIVLENPVCTLGLVVTSVQVTLDQDPGSEQVPALPLSTC